MRYHVTVGGEGRVVERVPGGVRLDGEELPARLHWVGPGEATLELDGERHRVFARSTGAGWRVGVRGRTFLVSVEDERTRAIRELAGDAGAAGGPAELRAPMPGLVVRVLVEVGQQVEPGDALVVVEAMKMENELRAEGAGVVAAVHATAGAAVDRDEVLVAFEADG